MIKFRFLRALSALLFLAALAILNSCLDPKWDFERISDEVLLTPGIAAPVVYGTITINDILEEIDSTEYLNQDEDGLLYLTFLDELFSYSAQDFFSIPDQSFTEFFIESDFAFSPEWTTLAVDDTATFSKNRNTEFLVENNERIDSMNIKSMDLIIDAESTFKQDAYLTIFSPNILKNGVPYQRTVKVSAKSGTYSKTEVFTEEDYFIFLDTSNPDKLLLPMNFDFSVVKSGSPVLPTDSINISISLKNSDFYSVFGFFGTKDLIVSDGEFNIDIFDSENFDAGSLLFADPQFNIKVTNSYGLPAEIDLSGLQTYSRINDVTTDIAFKPGVNPFSIDAPDFSTIGDTVITNIQINKDNCNIVDALATTPSILRYSFYGVTNPQGNNPSENFVTDSSRLNVDFEILLPVWISAEGFSVETEEEFDFDDLFGDEADIIDYLRVTLDITNGFPAEVDMQLYFLDENRVVVDSMFNSDGFLIPPFVNEQDVVEGPVEQSKSIEFTDEKINRIEGSKYLRIKANVSTPGVSTEDFIKFYSYYTLDYKVKVKADLSISSRDF